MTQPPFDLDNNDHRNNSQGSTDHAQTSLEIDQLVPHSGDMSLLDGVLDYDHNGISAEAFIRPYNLFIKQYSTAVNQDALGVPAWVGIEYMAQAVAAWSSLRAKQGGDSKQKAKVGFLLGTRRYQSQQPWFPVHSRLVIRAVLSLESANGLSSFECQLHCCPYGDDATPFEPFEASASLNLFLPKDASEFLQTN